MKELHELLLLNAAVAVYAPLCELLLELADGEGGLRYGERRVSHRDAALVSRGVSARLFACSGPGARG